MKQLAINCPDNCSFRPGVVGPDQAEKLKRVAETGAGRMVFARQAEAILGYTLNSSSVSRHLAHYVEIDDSEPVSAGPKPSDIEILDSIIVSGFRNSRNWKPTIRDTLEAMKLKVQMTGNSAFDDLIALFDGEEDEEGLPEAPEAIFAEDERPEEPDDDLGVPLGAE